MSYLANLSLRFTTPFSLLGLLGAGFLALWSLHTSTKPRILRAQAWPPAFSVGPGDNATRREQTNPNAARCSGFLAACGKMQRVPGRATSRHNRAPSDWTWIDAFESGGGGAFARGSPGQHEGPPGEERLPDHLGKAHTDSNNERRSAYPHGKEPEDPPHGVWQPPGQERSVSRAHRHGARTAAVGGTGRVETPRGVWGRAGASTADVLHFVRHLAYG